MNRMLLQILLICALAGIINNTVVILIIMSLIIIFLEAKAMYKIIFKDICFVNESCSMYFFFSICNIFF